MSRSVSVSHPWSNKRFSVVLLFHNKYITVEVFAHLLNLKTDAIKTNIVPSIPQGGGYTNFISLEHMKDYVSNVLHWKDEDVKAGMAQFGFQEEEEEQEKEVHAISTVHRTYSGKKRERSVAAVAASAEAAEDGADARKKRELELIQERTRALIDEKMNLKAVVEARRSPSEISSAPEGAEEISGPTENSELPPCVQDFLNSTREHVLTKAVRVYKASEDWKARVAAAVAMRKHEIKQKIEQKMRAEKFPIWYNDLYMQQTEALKREAIAERTALAVKETERLLAQAKEKNWMW